MSPALVAVLIAAGAFAASSATTWRATIIMRRIDEDRCADICAGMKWLT